MVVSKYKNFLVRNIFELILFTFFILYFSLWINFNFSTINLNNNDLETAIELSNYKPYLSFYLNNILSLNSIKFFFGFCFFPSLVAVIIFKIFKKILSSNMWSFSLTILSLTATENFPFINFLIGFLKKFDLKTNVNLYENFEIMGFPIPSFSIFFFCFVFYLSLNIIRISKIRIFLLTFLWLLMIHIHPVDGFIGNLYWISWLSILYIQKKIKLSTKNILFLFFVYLINIFLVINQLTFDALTINITQSISLYNIFFYFILSPMLMIICILVLKIDLYEFYQRFLNIYLLMFVEIILVLASINGIGFELAMIETRISMFLLHFLYYVPVIYYLSKDEIFYVNTINKGSYRGRIAMSLYYIFNKYKYIYLLTFILLIFLYFIFSLKI
jgi:hypothetical protein|tara:strand:- start:29 stop:1189 length:1161 start_codon:yes stop_codon:yes gene_type:complete